MPPVPLCHFPRPAPHSPGRGVVHSVGLDGGAVAGVPRSVQQVSPTALEILSPPSAPVCGWLILTRVTTSTRVS